MIKQVKEDRKWTSDNHPVSPSFVLGSDVKGEVSVFTMGVARLDGVEATARPTAPSFTLIFFDGGSSPFF